MTRCSFLYLVGVLALLPRCASRETLEEATIFVSVAEHDATELAQRHERATKRMEHFHSRRHAYGLEPYLGRTGSLGDPSVRDAILSLSDELYWVVTNAMRAGGSRRTPTDIVLPDSGGSLLGEPVTRVLAAYHPRLGDVGLLLATESDRQLAHGLGRWLGGGAGTDVNKSATLEFCRRADQPGFKAVVHGIVWGHVLLGEDAAAKRAAAAGEDAAAAAAASARLWERVLALVGRYVGFDNGFAMRCFHGFGHALYYLCEQHVVKAVEMCDLSASLGLAGVESTDGARNATSALGSAPHDPRSRSRRLGLFSPAAGSSAGLVTRATHAAAPPHRQGGVRGGSPSSPPSPPPPRDDAADVVDGRGEGETRPHAPLARSGPAAVREAAALDANARAALSAYCASGVFHSFQVCVFVYACMCACVCVRVYVCVRMCVHVCVG